MHRRAEKLWWRDEVAAGCALGHFLSNSDSAVGVVPAI